MVTNLINYCFSDLERAACAFALLCMISMVLGLVLGAYGLLGKHLKMFVWASICSLTAGKHELLTIYQLFQLHIIKIWELLDWCVVSRSFLFYFWIQRYSILLCNYCTIDSIRSRPRRRHNNTKYKDRTTTMT